MEKSKVVLIISFLIWFISLVTFLVEVPAVVFLCLMMLPRLHYVDIAVGYILALIAWFVLATRWPRPTDLRMVIAFSLWLSSLTTFLLKVSIKPLITPFGINPGVGYLLALIAWLVLALPVVYEKKYISTEW